MKYKHLQIANEGLRYNNFHTTAVLATTIAVVCSSLTGCAVEESATPTQYKISGLICAE